MDKLSALLIGAVCFLICVSTAVVYTTWFKEPDAIAPASTVKEIQEEMELANIAMNTQAQVINGGSREMWVRVKVEISDREGVIKDQQGYARDYELVSDTISDKPTETELKKGVWVPEEDGYYYYSVPVSPGEQSKSLFESVKAKETGGGAPESSSVKVRAEGIQVNWVSEMAETGQEAYRFFSQYKPLNGRMNFV